MRHSFWKLEECNCGSDCCAICVGGLSICKNCGGVEGSLPSECPVQRMTSEQEDAVYDGRLDYCNGEWVQESRWLDMQRG